MRRAFLLAVLLVAGMGLSPVRAGLPPSTSPLTLTRFGAQVEVGNLLLLVGSPARHFSGAERLCSQVHQSDERFELVRVSHVAAKAKEFRTQLNDLWVWALDDRQSDSLELKPVGVQVGSDHSLFFLPENSAAALWATLHPVCAAKTE